MWLGTLEAHTQVELLTSDVLGVQQTAGIFLVKFGVKRCEVLLELLQ